LHVLAAMFEMPASPGGGKVYLCLGCRDEFEKMLLARNVALERQHNYLMDVMAEQMASHIAALAKPCPGPQTGAWGPLCRVSYPGGHPTPRGPLPGCAWVASRATTCRVLHPATS
jgi:hypothetical protein